MPALLVYSAWFNVGLFALALALYFADRRTILGINAWIKPMKFASSVAIYVWTLAFFLRYLDGAPSAVHYISLGVAIAMLVEMICIFLQAARGVTSHFNSTTALDGAIFAIMGVFIVLNSVFAGWALFLFFNAPPALEPAYLWGIRLGLLIFLIGSSEGFVMVARLAHTIGAPDGGPGLPFVNWSTRHGDLRPAHFLGLHALQIVPFAGYWIAKFAWADGVAWMSAAALLYAAVVFALALQAVRGRPLLKYFWGR